MGFKRGLIIGGGIGYVLGAKAGRERYQQIIKAWHGITGNPQVQKAADKSKELAAAAGKKSLHAVQDGVEKATGAVKERLHKDNGQASDDVNFVPPPAAATPGGPTPP